MRKAPTCQGAAHDAGARHGTNPRPDTCTVCRAPHGPLHPAGPCEDVAIEIRKSVLKQGAVQHLFGRVAARLRRGRNDAHLLAALHPTPAVCGRPREAALG